MQFSCHSVALKMLFLSVEYILSVMVNDRKNIRSSAPVELSLHP